MPAPVNRLDGEQLRDAKASPLRGCYDLGAGMHLVSDTQDGRLRILALGGDIDLHFAPVLRTLFEETKGTADALVLDLSEATFIDSSGIAMVIEHLRNATRAGRLFCIGGMSPQVKEIFDVICLRKAMRIFDTKAEALEAIARNQITKPEQPLFTAADS